MFCHLPLRSRQCKWKRGFRGMRFCVGFYQSLPAALTGNKPQVIFSVWSVSPPAAWMKIWVFAWKLACSCWPRCSGFVKRSRLTTVPTFHVFGCTSLPRKSRFIKSHSNLFQFSTNTCYNLHLPHLCINDRYSTFFESQTGFRSHY